MNETEKEAIDKYWMQVLENINKIGYHMTGVFSAEKTNTEDFMPNFIYTIGLYETYKVPEFIMFGLDLKLMADIISKIVGEIKNGKEFLVDVNYPEYINDYSIRFLGTINTEVNKYTNGIFKYYEEDHIPIRQITWPDKESLFPTDENFDKIAKIHQPILK